MAGLRSVFNAILLVLGLAVIAVVAVTLNLSHANYNDPRLIIEAGSMRSRPVGGADGRALYAVLQARADEVNTPLSADSGEVFFIIENGETAQSVAQKLQAMTIIHDAELFAQLLRYNGIDTRLQTGEYQLRRNMTMKEIGAALYRGWAGRFALTVPAGWRLEELAEHLNSTGIINGQQFLRTARRGASVNHHLLADRPPGQSYEGYLFPDTYYLLDTAKPEDLIAAMLNNLDSKLPDNVFELAQQQGLTFYQVLTLASIVERETNIPQERPIIASVYLNRLRPNSPYPHLQADPTVQYAMGYQPDSGQWWKSPVQLDEYQFVNSPYNTYLYAGLPPGPIASPSLESIMAVLQPAQTSYYFFVCRRPHCEGGDHVFAQTYQEHLQNAAVYWGQ